MCARIAQADSRLAGLIDSSRTMTQEIREALVETDRVRSECRLKMLDNLTRSRQRCPRRAQEIFGHGFACGAEARRDGLVALSPIALANFKLKPEIRAVLAVCYDAFAARSGIVVH